MTRAPARRRLARLAAGACFAGAAVLWWTAGTGAAAVTAGPAKTAWYDRTGAQNVTGETTPSAAQPGELEVSYVPAQATAPQQTLPPAPTVPGAPVGPPQGNAGGNSVGYALAFAAVDYQVPLEVQGQAVDPSSVTAVLTLALDQASSGNVADGDLIACPTITTLWSAGGDQDASQAPQYSCAQSVSGHVDSTANTVTFDLTAAQENSLSAGSFSLVIVPGTTPAGAFEAVFAAPSAQSLVVTNESPAANPDTNLDQSAASPDSGTADLAAGTSGFALQPFAPASPGTAAGGPQAPSASASTPGGRFTVAAPAALRGGLGAGVQRTIAVLVLVALGTVLVLASSNPARAPRSLRALARAAAGRSPDA